MGATSAECVKRRMGARRVGEGTRENLCLMRAGGLARGVDLRRAEVGRPPQPLSTYIARPRSVSWRGRFGPRIGEAL